MMSCASLRAWPTSWVTTMTLMPRCLASMSSRSMASVEAGSRLAVGSSRSKHLRIEAERPRKTEPLLLAAGQHPCRCERVAFQPGKLQGLPCADGSFAARNAAQAQARSRYWRRPSDGAARAFGTPWPGDAGSRHPWRLPPHRIRPRSARSVRASVEAAGSFPRHSDPEMTVMPRSSHLKVDAVDQPPSASFVRDA